MSGSASGIKVLRVVGRLGEWWCKRYVESDCRMRGSVELWRRRVERGCRRRV